MTVKDRFPDWIEKKKKDSTIYYLKETHIKKANRVKLRDGERELE